MKIDEAIQHCKELVRDNREDAKYAIENELHDAVIKTCIKCAEEHEQLAKWLEELKEYKELEEKDLLLKLPCKVGSDVYVLDHRFVSTGGIIECYIDEFTIDKKNKCYAVLSGKEPFYIFRRFKAVNIREFGETVFLTKEAAEEELKRLESAE